jgi:hypothetical protein
MAEAVMSADAAFAAARQVAARRYAIGYAGPDGGERTVGLPDALPVAFEVVPPVRSFARYRGQRSNTGLWWSASTGGHVGFESWLERDHLMLLDFDPMVSAIASQARARTAAAPPEPGPDPRIEHHVRLTCHRCVRTAAGSRCP